MTDADFKKGERVRLSRVRHGAFIGRVGVVHKTIKSRGVVRVKFNDGSRTTDYYDATPANLDKIAED